MKSKGRVYWITGLSGAGKTTIGDLLFEKIGSKDSCFVRLDGDNLRQVFSNKNYSEQGRIEIGLQYSALCKLLSDQGINVIISTICMYDVIRNWNRENIADYYEIYLKVTIDELIRRDQKGLYSGALAGEIKDVMGINMDYEEPKNPDLILSNDGENSPEDQVDLIISRLKILNYGV